MSSIGCHTQHLGCFAADSRVNEVSAETAALMPGRKVIDYTSAHMRFANGARGTSPSAGGSVREKNPAGVYGDKGCSYEPSGGELPARIPQGEPTRTYTRGDPGCAGIAALWRTPPAIGGNARAFANLYRKPPRIMARNLAPAPRRVPAR